MDAKRQMRSSSLLLAGRVLSLGTNLLVQVLVVRALSKAGYGVFAYAMSIATIGEGLVTLGLHRAVVRYVPIYDEMGDRPRALGTIVLTLGATVATGVAAMLLVWGFRGWFAGEMARAEHAVLALVTLSALAPIQGLDRLFVGFFSVFGRARAIFVRRFLITPGLRLLVIAILIAQGGNVVMLSIGYVVTGVIGVAVYGTLFVRLLRDRGYLGSGESTPLVFPAREVFTFALPLLTTEIVFAGINHADSVMLGQMTGPEDVASLRAVYPLARLNQVVLEMFAMMFTPIAARFYQRKDYTALNTTYWRTATWVAILTFPIFAFTFSLSRPLTEFLFGARYAGSGVLLALLTLGYYAHASLGPNGMVLNVYRLVRFVVVVNVIAFLAKVAGNLFLIPEMGAEGAAIATAGTLIVHNLMKQWGLRRATGVRVLDPAAVRPFATVVGAVALLAAIEWIWKPPPVVAGGAALATSVLVLGANRSRLDVLDTFPELARLPLLGRLLRGRGRS